MIVCHLRPEATEIEDHPANRQRQPATPRGRRYLILNGGYLSAVPSGGDRHLLSLAAALATDHPVDFVAPDAVRQLLPKAVRPVLYRSALPRSLAGVLAAYANRTVRAMAAAWRQPANCVLASPGLFDVLPAALHRWRYRSRSAVFVFHLGNPRATRSRSLAQRWLSLAAQALAARLWQRADVIITSTTEVAAQLGALGVPAERILLQRPCVDAAAIRQVPILSAPDVLFIGRLVRRKGVHDLITAAADFDFSVGLVGDGEERENLRREILKRGMDSRVEIYGPVSDQRAWGLLRGARCLVLPSYEEGYGLVIAEAIVAGIPVIAYDLPHYAEVFGDAITCVPRGDVASLGYEIHALLSGDRRQQQERCRAAQASVHIETSESAAAALADRLEPPSSGPDSSDS